MSFDNSNFPELPGTWAAVAVDEASSNVPIKQKIPTKAYLPTGKLAVIDQGSALIGGYWDDPSSAVKAVPPVVVFGDHTRALKFIDFPFAAGADGIKVLKPHNFIEPRVFFRFLQAIRLPDRGYSRHFQFLRSSRIAVPPANEQKRIADKLDAVLARVDACRNRLDRIPAILKRFRQSVLAAATLGALTEDWRSSTALDGWSTAPLADLCHSVSDGDHQAPPQSDSGIPFITISAINDGKLRLEKAIRFVPLTYFEALKPGRQPVRGDVLFSVTGSIGIPALVDIDSPFTFQRHIAILKPNHTKIISKFLLIALGTEDVRQQALAVATGTAQLTIPLNGLRSLAIPLPPFGEQTEIVRRVETLFAFADRLEARHSAAHAQVENLTPSLLAKAFRGELVAQDPNDEPASVLLERIASKRTATEFQPRRRQSTSARKPTRALKENAAVTKSRQDEDVQGKPYLAQHLRRLGGSASAEALFKVSDLPVADFYKQLAWEVAKGHIKDGKKVLELADAA
jgi:restriction endonuclease S subunit